MSVFRARDLKTGDTLLREEHTPLLFMRHIKRRGKTNWTCVFRDLETGGELPFDEWLLTVNCERKGWHVLERSSQLGHSGRVETDGEDEDLDHGEQPCRT